MPPTKLISVHLNPTAIGARLRKARKSRGARQSTVGRAVGIDGSTMSLTESGKRLPNLKQLVELCCYYRRSIEWVLFGTARHAKAWRHVALDSSGTGPARAAPQHAPPGR